MQVFLYFPNQSKSVRYLEVNLAQNIHLVLKKMSAITNVRYKSVRYIEVFLWELDRDSAGSLKRCPLYNMSAIDRFDCIYLFSSILIRRYVSGMSNKLPSPLQTTLKRQFRVFFRGCRLEYFRNTFRKVHIHMKLFWSFNSFWPM